MIMAIMTMAIRIIMSEFHIGEQGREQTCRDGSQKTGKH